MARMKKQGDARTSPRKKRLPRLFLSRKPTKDTPKGAEAGLASENTTPNQSKEAARLKRVSDVARRITYLGGI